MKCLEKCIFIECSSQTYLILDFNDDKQKQNKASMLWRNK